jgi:hypothetical protein
MPGLIRGLREAVVDAWWDSDVPTGVFIVIPAAIAMVVLIGLKEWRSTDNGPARVVSFVKLEAVLSWEPPDKCTLSVRVRDAEEHQPVDPDICRAVWGDQ